MAENKTPSEYHQKRKSKGKRSVPAVCIGVILLLLFTQINKLFPDLFGGVNISPDFTVPVYTGEAFTVVNNGIPYFEDSDLTTSAFEDYSHLDGLGRCGSAYACLGKETMPTEKRGAIGMIKPSGWHTVRYDDLIEDKYLYNRCHLIAFMLSGENANERNLITGTRYMNVEGMLPFENKTADYIKKTGNHVLYRVTPYYDGDGLVALGVLMEAQSVEDGGAGLMFNVFVHNVQPGVKIDYQTGESERE